VVHARRLDQLFDTGKADFLAQRFQPHVAPAMKIHVVMLFNRSDERIAPLLAQSARQIPRPRTGNAGVIVPNWRRFVISHNNLSRDLSLQPFYYSDASIRFARSEPSRRTRMNRGLPSPTIETMGNEWDEHSPGGSNCVVDRKSRSRRDGNSTGGRAAGRSAPNLQTAAGEVVLKLAVRRGTGQNV